MSYKSIEFRKRETVFVRKYDRTYSPKIKNFENNLNFCKRQPWPEEDHLPLYQWRSTYFEPWCVFTKCSIFGDLLLKCRDPLRYPCASVLCIAHTHTHTPGYNSFTHRTDVLQTRWKKRFSSLTVSSYRCLHIFFFLSPRIILRRRPDDYIALHPSFPSPPLSTQQFARKLRERADCCPIRRAILYNIHYT